MNRIKEIRIINSPRKFYVDFLDQVDIDNGLLGKTYTPSAGLIDFLRRIIRVNRYTVDLNLVDGVITCYPSRVDYIKKWQSEE